MMKKINQADKANIYEQLSVAKVMQIATVANDQPWVVSVYFVADTRLNLYWLSLPSRRHSLELKNNNKAAITMALKTDQPVIGISSEGQVTEVKSQKVINKVMKLYTKKYNVGHNFVGNFLAQKNQHVMYKFTPSCYVLFDEVNNADDPCGVLEIS